MLRYFISDEDDMEEESAKYMEENFKLGDADLISGRTLRIR